MSHGPPRSFPSINYPTIPNNNIPRQQQVLNGQQQQQQQQNFGQALVTSTGPSPTLGHLGQSTPNVTASASNSPSNTSGGGTRGITTPSSTHETLYCDSCQTFRHVSFFNERDFKYNVCNICHTRELQKRKHQMERYEMYDEQQRTYKQGRYSQPIQQQQQQQMYATPLPIQQPQLHSSAPINLGGNSNNSSGSNHTSPLPPPQTISSPQIKQSPPTSSMMLTLAQVNNNTNNASNTSASTSASNNNTNNNKSHMFSNPAMRNQSQLQSHMHSQQLMQPLPLPNQDLHQALKHEPIVLPSTTTSNTTTTSNMTTNTTTTNTVVTPAPVTHRTTTSSAERASQDIINFETFVRELEKETEFDRKQYHLDIGPLMESMGEGAGFTQLGRGICEKVLEGTKFNFR